MPSPFLEVVICTYNRARVLERTLDSLASQADAQRCAWTVLVVNNNSTDETASVVNRWIDSGRIPGLRCIRETTPGVLYARLAGARNSTAEWIAFVDDDCFLGPRWIASAYEFARDAHGCGVFGGRVILLWEAPPPPYLRQIGWLFAEQEMGKVAVPVDYLVGAGMVVRRSALTASGYTEHQLLPDRVGNEVITGGDVEITQRIRSAGYQMWYVPECELEHFIPASRLSLGYVVRLTRALGVSQALCAAAMAPPRSRGWAATAVLIVRTQLFDATTQIRYSLSNAAREILVRLTFASGLVAGIFQLARMADANRNKLLGAASIDDARNSREPGGVSNAVSH